MDKILFPSQYKRAILAKTKNTTIRIKNEMGKYKTGRTYTAHSYAGNSWKQKITITKIFKSTVAKLKEYGIPDKTINSIKNTLKIRANEQVEIINFKIHGNTTAKKN